MSSSYALLGLLEQHPSYGYDLKRAYDRLFAKGKKLAFGQVYAQLSRLNRDRLIESHGSENSGGPERKRYSITPAGVQALRIWLQTPEQPESALRATLFTKTVLSLLLQQDADRALDGQRVVHIARMRELTRQRKNAGLAEVLLIDHALFHLEADLRWIDMTMGRLQQLTEEVINI